MRMVRIKTIVGLQCKQWVVEDKSGCNPPRNESWQESMATYWCFHLYSIASKDLKRCSISLDISFEKLYSAPRWCSSMKELLTFIWSYITSNKHYMMSQIVNVFDKCHIDFKYSKQLDMNAHNFKRPWVV